MTWKKVYVGLFCFDNIQQRGHVDGIKWTHETQRFILVWGVVCTKPYSSGATALVFICSIIGVVAPSYEVDGIGGRRWILGPRSLLSFI
jgi:hypothetical protein